MSRFLGVDPGLEGALALWDTTTDTLIVQDMPIVTYQMGRSRRRELNECVLAGFVREMRPDYAWVEKVHSMPKQGVASSFNFGVGFGVVRGVLGALDVRVAFVTAQEWKRFFRLGADKQQSRLAAARLFPDHSKLFARQRDDGRAEASLLARFGADAAL